MNLWNICLPKKIVHTLSALTGIQTCDTAQKQQNRHAHIFPAIFLQIHVGLLNESVLELKGLLHGLLRRDERVTRDAAILNNNNNMDDVTDSDRNSPEDDRLNLVTWDRFNLFLHVCRNAYFLVPGGRQISFNCFISNTQANFKPVLTGFKPTLFCNIHLDKY
jgi:hypothetical protein